MSRKDVLKMITINIKSFQKLSKKQIDEMAQLCPFSSYLIVVDSDSKNSKKKGDEVFSKKYFRFP